MSTNLHRCPTCGAKHAYPKAHRALSLLAWALACTAVEVLAAFALDGWLVVALWLLVARNAIIFVGVVYGLAQLAVENEATR